MSFKDHRDPIVSEAKSNSISEFILEAFTIRAQIHLSHLVTKSFAQHLALQEFYESLEDCIDSIAEKSIGQGVALNGDSQLNITYNFDNSDVLHLISTFRDTVTRYIEITSKPHNLSLNDDFVEIQSNIDMLSYKLQLT